MFSRDMSGQALKMNVENELDYLLMKDKSSQLVQSFAFALVSYFEPY